MDGDLLPRRTTETEMNTAQKETATELLWRAGGLVVGDAGATARKLYGRALMWGARTYMEVLDWPAGHWVFLLFTWVCSNLVFFGAWMILREAVHYVKTRN